MRATIDERCAASTVSGGVRVTRFAIRSREEGQTMTEYAVILGVITPVILLAFAAMSDAVASRIQGVVGFLS
jgi:Flp pilus assembly pilin Flp